MRGLVVLAVLAGALVPAGAQEGPAEQPGQLYPGRSYVDSKGCAFQRAVLSGTVLWVARNRADGTPVCGLAPTLPPVAVAAEPAEPAATPAEAPVVRAAKRAAKPAVLAGRWIQVGAFGDPGNAERALGRLAALGLPRATLAVKGGRLKAVLAGPFEEKAAFAEAVTLLRQSGFADLLGRP